MIPPLLVRHFLLLHGETSDSHEYDLIHYQGLFIRAEIPLHFYLPHLFYLSPHHELICLRPNPQNCPLNYLNCRPLTYCSPLFTFIMMTDCSWFLIFLAPSAPCSHSQSANQGCMVSLAGSASWGSSPHRSHCHHYMHDAQLLTKL
jgi:hypothetical protein